MPLSTPKVIYLDQNAWIDLANSSRETIDLVTTLSESDSVIFPLSIVHLEETSKDHNLTRKQELASLMIRISKGYCFLPYVDQIIEKEIRREVFRRLGLTLSNTDLRNYVLKKGICNMIGVKPSVVKRKSANIPDQPPNDVKKKMLDFLDTPEAMLSAFLVPYECDIKIRQMREEAVKKMEQNREGSLKIRDKASRREAVFGEFIIDVIGQMVAKVMTELNVPRDRAFFVNWTKKDVEDFINHIPTALCLYTLLLKRDEQSERPIQVNDIADVWALSLAIPYSDVVVTEKMWTSILMQETKLAKKCNTIIVKSISELIPLLRS